MYIFLIIKGHWKVWVKSPCNVRMQTLLDSILVVTMLCSSLSRSLEPLKPSSTCIRTPAEVYTFWVHGALTLVFNIIPKARHPNVRSPNRDVQGEVIDPKTLIQESKCCTPKPWTITPKTYTRRNPQTLQNRRLWPLYCRIQPPEQYFKSKQVISSVRSIATPVKGLITLLITCLQTPAWAFK